MNYAPLDREFLLKRGYCCHSGCQNCPYDEEIDASTPQELSTTQTSRDYLEEAEKYLEELE